MCEDAGCNHTHERVRPELLAQLKDRVERTAARRGKTVDELLKDAEGPDRIGPTFAKLRF